MAKGGVVYKTGAELGYGVPIAEKETIEEPAMPDTLAPKRDEKLARYVIEELDHRDIQDEDDTLTEQNSPSEEEYDITDEAEWWAMFNINPTAFDLGNDEVYRKIVEAWTSSEWGEAGRFTDKDYPRKQTLIKAAKERELNTSGRKKTIEDTFFYQKWLSCQVYGDGEFRYDVLPSLDDIEAREKQAKPEQTKLDQAAELDNEDLAQDMNDGEEDVMQPGNGVAEDEGVGIRKGGGLFERLGIPYEILHEDVEVTAETTNEEMSGAEDGKAGESDDEMSDAEAVEVTVVPANEEVDSGAFLGGQKELAIFQGHDEDEGLPSETADIQDGDEDESSSNEDGGQDQVMTESNTSTPLQRLGIPWHGI